MWYFAWMLGVGFAVLLAVMNAMWGELVDGFKRYLRRAFPDAAMVEVAGGVITVICGDAIAKVEV